MRRNDVVRLKNDGFFFGRVIRIIDDKALWICCGLHFHLTPIKDLEVTNYKGKMEWTNSDGVMYYYHRDKDGFLDFDRGIKYKRPARFIHMTTLRKLKQRATGYHGRNVWKTPLDYEFLITE